MRLKYQGILIAYLAVDKFQKEDGVLTATFYMEQTC